MKKALIFGGSGFLGSYVSDELMKRGFEVFIADLYKSNYLKGNQKFIKVDVLNSEDVKKIVIDKDFVYNFSAVAELEEASNNPLKTFHVNVIGNLNILEACKEARNIERFVFASSAYALSNEGSFYGASKLCSEKITEEYFKKFALRYTIIRYGSLYGERASNNNYIYKLLSNAIKTGKLQYNGDDNDIREYIHSADAAKLSVDILEDKKFENEYVMLTGTEKLKRKELISMINEIMQNKLNIEKISDKSFGHYKLTPYSYNPTFAKKLIANPFIDLGQGILKCIQEINKEFTK